MKFEPRHLTYLFFGLGAAVLFYLSRAVLMPFFLAAAFAYLLNPVVSLLMHRLRLPRTVSVFVIYLILIGLLAAAVLGVGVRFNEESVQFGREARVFIQQANTQIYSLPTWLQPVALDIFESVRTSLLLPNRRLVTYLPGALNRTISVMVFLVAAFYFLKDGHYFLDNFFRLFPQKSRKGLEEIAQKINRVLGNYLRGQLFLIVIMSALTYIGLLLIGVRYALILSIFTGFAEIVPFVGPLAAASIAAIVGFTDQFSRLGLTPVLDVIAIVSLYTVLRQLEDLFVIPQVMARMTRLHPLVVLFSVLAGGHIFGVIGYIVSVPIVASVKVVIEHVLESKRGII